MQQSERFNGAGPLPVTLCGTIDTDTPSGRALSRPHAELPVHPHPFEVIRTSQAIDTERHGAPLLS